MKLRGFGTEKEWPFCVELMCWTEEGVELRETSNKECIKAFFHSPRFLPMNELEKTW